MGIDRTAIEAKTGPVVAVGLIALVECQGVVSRNVPGALDGSRETLVAYAYGLMEEVHETLREIGVKAWKEPTPPNINRVVEEAADILAFIGILLINLAKACDMTPAEFAACIALQYQITSKNNLQRFENGRQTGGIHNMEEGI